VWSFLLVEKREKGTITAAGTELVDHSPLSKEKEATHLPFRRKGKGKRNFTSSRERKRDHPFLTSGKSRSTHLLRRKGGRG